MSGDLASSIILTMAPIFVLMIGLVVYSVVKNRGKVKGRSKHETDALIEAQAMLAKYQKEQAEKEAGSKKDEKPEPKPEKSEDKKPEEKTKEDSEEKDKDASKKNKSEEKVTKPTADAPISDTTELEPDIDKTSDK